MHVQCDGGGGALGHPVEYLTLEKGGQTVCKYCDRRYVHKSRAEAEAIRKAGRRFAA
ncbi:MAG: zinc-finger domain-containing protein [Geminicoccaceae bacterium]